MQYTIISSSHLDKSNSLKVSNYIKQQLSKSSETHLFDLKDQALAMWSPKVYENEAQLGRWLPIKKALTQSDGIVVVTPEYNGMATPILKNFFLYASANELAHKAALIVSVSSGIGGSYPINELRSSSYKNLRICYVPDHIVVRFAGKVLNEADAVDDSDKITRRRIEHGLQVFTSYSQALAEMRKKTTLMQEDLPNGM